MTTLRALLLALAALLPASPVLAESISVFANSAHQVAFQRGRTGNSDGAQAAFEKATGDKVAWNAVPWPEMRASLLRSLAASSAEYDVVMVINEWATPVLKRKLLPLAALMAAQPLEAPDDIFAGMRAPFVQDGVPVGIPIRSNPQIVHYNRETFAAAGLAPPETMEALLDAAQKLAGKRTDGARTFGLALKPDEDILVVVRALGGQVLDASLGIHVREPPVLAALQRLRALYAAGALPPNFATMDATSVQSLMREGLSAMVFFGDNYFVRFNDPKTSHIAGKVGFFPMPGGASTGQRYAPTKVTFWAASIPATLPAPRQAAAWRLIRAMASPASQLQMAVTGNGPVRASTLDDPTFAAEAPYAAASRIALAHATDLLPVFEGSAEVNDAFTQGAVTAILGKASPEDAMAEAEARIAEIVKRTAGK